MIQLDDTTVDALRAETARLQHELATKNQLVIAIARGQAVSFTRQIGRSE